MKKNKARSLPPEDATPTVRQRTLAHMEDLMRKATTLRITLRNADLYSYWTA